MRFFLDTACISDIKSALNMGIISGVTTNPTLISKERAKDFHGHIKTIASMVEGSVSAEVLALDAQGMISEGRELAKISPNVTIKIPMTIEGLSAVRALSLENISTNVTLIFSVQQALLAAAAGATYVSPFVGRLDDIGTDGVALVAAIREIYDIHDIDTQIIAASIRHAKHIEDCARAGAHIATVPYGVLTKLAAHPLTDKGIELFLKDWEALKNNK